MDGEDRDVFKSPIDAPFKQSKRGRVTLIKTLGAHGVGYTSGLATTSNREDEALQIVFEDGELVFEDTFSEIRRRAAYYSWHPGVLWYDWFVVGHVSEPANA